MVVFITFFLESKSLTFDYVFFVCILVLELDLVRDEVGCLKVLLLGLMRFVHRE
jgi:hypothetical protein